MKIVVHADSAFNMVFFNRWLKKEQWETVGYFFNPETHPYTEYNRQLLMQKLLSVLEDIITIYPEYSFEDYLKGVAALPTQEERCAFCYRHLLEHTAQYAKTLQIPYFSTSWLVHPQHNHALLRSVGEEVAEKYDLKFLFHDFSKLWDEAKELATKFNIYQPQYCGCIYSERYRFYAGTLAAFNKEHVAGKKSKSRAS